MSTPDPNLTRSYPVTPTEFSNFRTLGAANGVTIPPGNSGQVVEDGVTIDFAYDDVMTLVLTIVDKPWYIPASAVWDALAKFLPAPTPPADAP
jgi:hypothetical protein